jgi:tetratricopeptide (TPR) repeat protein
MSVSNAPHHTQPEPTPDFEAQCRAVYGASLAGDISADDAIAQLTALAQRARDEGLAANQGRVEHLLGNLHHYRGSLNTSILHFERAQDFFKQVDNRQRVAMMDLNLGEVYRYKGDFARARQLYRHAYETASTLGLVDVMTLAIANEGLLLLHLNRHEAACAALEEGYELAQQWTDSVQNRHAVLTEIHAGLTRVYLRRADPVSAWQHALSAMLAAEHGSERIHHGIARLALADALTALGAAPDADDTFDPDPDTHYQAAITVFREVRAEAELAHARYAHGRSLANRGRSLSAAREFQQAMILYTRLDMVADAARAAAAQLDVTG